MTPRWSDLDRRVQFLRATGEGDAFSDDVTGPGAFTALGGLIPAKRMDVSDQERWRAGEVAASLMSRFRVRWSGFTAGITPADRLVCEGLTFDIVGVKEVDGRRWLEITGSARTDL